MDQKDELEQQKLRAELDQIKWNIQNIQHSLQIETSKLELENRKFNTDNRRSWIIAIITITITVGTFYIQSSQFLSQSIREHQFHMSQELLTLVSKLNSGTPREQDDAAFLLTTYNEEAVPILLNNIRNVKDVKAIASSLKLLMEKKGVDRNKVLNSLIDTSSRGLKMEKAKLSPDVNIVTNYIDILGELATGKESVVVPIIKNIRDTIEQKERVSIADKTLDAEHADRACRKLTGKEC